MMPARTIRDCIAESPAVWPLQTHLAMAALPGAVPCARGHVRSVVREWGLGHLTDTAELLVSELVTNAVRASQSLAVTPGLPVVQLWLASDQLSVILHVWDASDQIPVRQQAGAHDSSGRGLLLVDALSAGWGCYRLQAGKVVWARVSP
jgi:anti-sigma regulatory factor (Ser/Thr protein kinase)